MTYSDMSELVHLPGSEGLEETGGIPMVSLGVSVAVCGGLGCICAARLSPLKIA